MTKETIAPTPPIKTATVTEIGFYITQGYKFVFLDVGNKLEVLDPQPEHPTSTSTGITFKGVWAKTDKNVVVFLDDGDYTLHITG
jgi:hypothetical protein